MYKIKDIIVSDSFMKMLADHEDKLRVVCTVLDRNYRLFSGATRKLDETSVNFLDCVFSGSPDTLVLTMRQVKEILDSEKPIGGKSLAQPTVKEKKKRGRPKK